MYLYKRYIPVIALIDEKGEVIPMFIIWEKDGDKKVYRVDKILHKRKSFSKVGGCGILYECMILHKKRKLYYERDKWFIEAQGIAQGPYPKDPYRRH